MFGVSWANLLLDTRSMWFAGAGSSVTTGCRYHRTALRRWSRASLLTLVLVCGGCAEGAKLLQETDTGGVVVYPYQTGRGPLLSSFRAEALQLIEKRCRGPYRIVREGEAKARNRITDSVAGPEVHTERRWGMEFQCNSSVRRQG
jgi:hypothetical protein